MSDCMEIGYHHCGRCDESVPTMEEHDSRTLRAEANEAAMTKERDEARAEVERLRAAMKSVAERQRQWDLDAVTEDATYPEDAAWACAAILRSPLVTEEE